MSSSVRCGSAPRRVALKSSSPRSAPPIWPEALRYTIFKRSELIVGPGRRRGGRLRRDEVMSLCSLRRLGFGHSPFELGVVVVEVAILGIERNRLRVGFLGVVVIVRAFLGAAEIEPCARRGIGVSHL